MPNENDSHRCTATHRGSRGPSQIASQPDEPAIALVTMNQLILDSSLEAVHKADPRNNSGISCVYAKSGGTSWKYVGCKK